MPNKPRTALLLIAAVAVLGAAAFVAFSLLNPSHPSPRGLAPPGAVATAGGKQAGVTYNVVPATEMPATPPDVVGRLEQRQDNSLMVRPDSKGAPAPLVEVVITSQTRLYRNATGDFAGTPTAPGATLPMVLAPIRPEEVSIGQRVIAWGQQRGQRLVADVGMIEGAPTAP